MSTNELQAELDGLAPGASLSLDISEGEKEGPAVLRKPVTIEGHGRTIWARRGPVLTIESHGVALRNLNVEVTGKEDKLVGEEACAIRSRRAPIPCWTM